ncbi:MAG: ABC transporter permease, partial [Deltaproteobacteria bacterium]|nr:ABC transporter permease [Deltaproteobacteria bacterium]
IWSILQPVAMVFVYTVIFSKIMRARVAGIDDTLAFGLFICAGLFTWAFFSELLGRCPNLFIDQANLLKKVNFPRLTLPATLLLSSTINFSIIFGIFLSFLILTGRFPGYVIISFLPLLLIQQAFALGLGMILGTLNVFFRDVGHFLNIVLQFWFWLTPIVYPFAIVPENIRNLLNLNPMTKIIVAYQQIILNGDWPQWEQFIFHVVIALGTLILGYMVFKSLSDDIVDEL